MSKKTIVVLEDNYSRVDWLRGILPTFEILQYEVVDEFVAAVSENKDKLALVVFDHDLGRAHPDPTHRDNRGMSLFNYDKNGKNGEDAAKAVAPFGCPALIWSNNGLGRSAISRALRDGPKTTKILLASYWGGMEYAATIGQLLKTEVEE